MTLDGYFYFLHGFSGIEMTIFVFTCFGLACFIMGIVMAGFFISNRKSKREIEIEKSVKEFNRQAMINKTASLFSPRTLSGIEVNSASFSPDGSVLKILFNQDGRLLMCDVFYKNEGR